MEDCWMGGCVEVIESAVVVVIRFVAMENMIKRRLTRKVSSLSEKM